MTKIGIIGEVRYPTANLSYSMANKVRIVKPELAGGALLDLGVYCLNFAFMFFGNKVAKIDSTAKLSKKGIDENFFLESELEDSYSNIHKH